MRLQLPQKVKIVEVGPRDGLQNEKMVLDTNIKVGLIESLVSSGLRVVEAGSFVSPAWVPQMANSDEVYQNLNRREGIAYPVLVPNIKGLERALDVGVTEVSCFTAASDTFNQRNINCDTNESLERLRPVIELAALEKIPVRGYVSCVAGCPYQGKVEKADVVRVVEHLLDMGCYEISLGDTIGVGTPDIVVALLESLQNVCSVDRLALHFHDTYGQALVNIYTGLQMGISIFDSSVAGLGGCPYASGASGNVATEDLVYMLDGLGIESGVDLDMLIKTGNDISVKLHRRHQSKVAIALMAKEDKKEVGS